MKKLVRKKTFTPISAVAAGFALAAVGAHADTTPLFDAIFPTSWSGTGTAVANQGSGAGIGNLSGSGYSYTTAAVPPGALGGTGSLALSSGAGGIKVTPDGSLNNATVAADGGFTYSIDFLWDGTDSSVFGHVEKLISYAGTEDLQLDTTGGGDSAILEMTYNVGDLTTGGSTTPVQVNANTFDITANTWYNVTLTFAGNSVDANGDILGTSDLYVDGSLIDSVSATKGSYGDSLNRPIGIGEWGYGVSTSTGGLHGDIYDASIDLGVAPVPEPTSLALAALGGLAMLGFRRKKS